MMTQPALSRAIRGLERSVGTPLFVRGARRIELTAAGSVLLAEAYEMVDRSRRALERARAARPRVEVLTVTVPPCDVVAAAMASRTFEEHNPGVRVRVLHRDRPSLPAELRAGRADVSFLRDCYDWQGLTVDPLTWESRMVLLPANHPLAQREKLSLSDLRDEKVTYWKGMTSAEVDHWSGADVDRRTRRHGPEVHSTTDVLAAVILGRAIAFSHRSLLPDEIPGVQIRPVEDLSPSGLAIGIPAHGASPIAKQFVEYAQKKWVGRQPLIAAKPGTATPG